MDVSRGASRPAGLLRLWRYCRRAVGRECRPDSGPVSARDRRGLARHGPASDPASPGLRHQLGCAGVGQDRVRHDPHRISPGRAGVTDGIEYRLASGPEDFAPTYELFLHAANDLRTRSQRDLLDDTVARRTRALAFREHAFRHDAEGFWLAE